MSAKKPERIVIVRKKKTSSGDGGGGAWKVAYADFVTAMMAFFMVMWIMGMDPDVKHLIQGYFNNPVGFQRSFSGGDNILSVGNSPVHIELHRLAMLTRDHQRRRFEAVREQIEWRLAATDELGGLEAQVEIVLTEEGLRIELVESSDGETFFAFASAELKPAARTALAIIAEELGQLQNDVMIEGHTDSVQYGSRRYTNWELSVERANTARRAMEEAGMEESRIREVRGYADRQLRVPDNPQDGANRRVSILLPFHEPSVVDYRLLTPPDPGRGAE